MQAKTIAQVIKASTDAQAVDRAVTTLRHFNTPLSEREKRDLIKFTEEKSTLLEAGTKEEDIEIPGHILPLLTKPMDAIPAVLVIQMIFALAKFPHVALRVQKVLQKQILQTACAQLHAEAPANIEKVLQLIPNAQNDLHNPTLLRCCEEMLKSLTKIVFSFDVDGKPEDFKDDVRSVQEKWCEVVALIVRRYSVIHARSTKKPLAGKPVTSHALFGTSVTCTRLHRHLKAFPKAADFVFNVFLKECTLSIKNGLAMWIFATSCPLEGAPAVFPHQSLVNTVRSVPGAVVEMLGEVPVVGTLRVDDAAAAVTALSDLSKMAATTSIQAKDIYTAISAFPEAQIQSVFVEKPDQVTKVLAPFYQNAKAFADPNIAITNATNVSKAIARKLNADGVAAILKLCINAIQSSCRASDDKVAVITFMTGIFNHVEDRSALPAGTAVLPLVKLGLNSSVVELLRASVECVVAAGAETDLKTNIDAAFKAHFKEESTRRALLVALKNADISAQATKLFDDAVEVEVYKPDAFLSLKGAAVEKPKEDVLKAISAAAVTEAFKRDDEATAAATAAIQALVKFNNAAPFAALATHRSGVARHILREFLHNKDTTTEQRVAVWKALTDDIFALTEGNTKAAQLPEKNKCADAVIMTASALLEHSLDVVEPETIAHMILACGHDNAAGHDATYFLVNPSDLHGKYPKNKLWTYAFDKIFTNDFDYLLEKHGESILETIVKALNVDGNLQLASAAGRALSLYLTRVNESFTCMAFGKIKALCQASYDYLQGLKELDAAIATGSTAHIRAYSDSVLIEKGFLKTYAARAPKGMSEEDYEDLQRKERKILDAEREKLDAQINKRAAQLKESITLYLSPFAALRAIGRAQASKIIGIEVIYPLLQKIVGDPEKTLSSVYEFAAEAANALLSGTPLRTVAGQMIRLAGVMNSHVHTSETIQQAASISTRLRIHANHMMDSPLMCVLNPFCSGAFKVARGRHAKALPLQAQHQLLNVFVANCGQEDAPQKGTAQQVLIDIMRVVPSLFKQTSHAMNSIATHSVEADLLPLVHAMFLASELTKDSATTAFSKYTHFRTTPNAQIVAAAMKYDKSNANVAKTAESILTNSDFEYGVDHWPLVLRHIETYAASETAVERLGCVVKDLFKAFTDSQSAWLAELLKIKGVSAAITIVQQIAEVLTSECIVSAMTFLCEVAENVNSDDDSMYYALEAGKQVLTVCSEKTLDVLTREVQPRLQNPPAKSTGDHKDNHAAISIVWQTTMAKRMGNTAFLEATIDQQLQALSTSQSAMVHEFACECMTTIAKEMRTSEKLTEFAKTCVKHAINAGSYPRKKAHAYGLAGVVAGLGVSSLRRFEVMSAIKAAATEKQAQRSGAMIVIEVLAETVGKSFEPYALQLIPQMLDAVSEKDAKISDCADDAAKAVMRNLSDVGLRQLVPLLVRGITSEQTKKRTPSLGFIGYVAFCSPKQLAATLPNIMLHITDCLCDANASVSNAAFTALRRVAGVVSNPEIQEQVDTILSAMRNPSGETEGALDSLIYTRFMNVVDPASLALILPIILRGLGERGHTVKGKAAQIVASMVKLVHDPKSLLPYATELLQKLEHAAQDPMAEVRTTSAKAISALGANLKTDIVDDITNWCFTLLGRGSTSAEKAGAAQVLAETITACGDALLYNVFDQIEDGFKHESASVREGFTYIMVYAPATLPVKMFQDFLPSSFPWVLKGLADSSEKVREVALAAGTAIINLYGTRNLKLVLDPLLEGVMSEQTTARQSSLLLSAKLMIHLVQQIKKKFKINVNDEENNGEGNSEENEDGEEKDGEKKAEGAKLSNEIVVESARDLEKKQGFSILGNLEEQLGAENFIRILAALHIGRSEHNAAVRTEVTTAWQICVASPRSAVSKIFVGIVTNLLKFASSETMEAVDVAHKAIEYTCARMQETSEKFVEAFAAEYHRGGLRHRIGALACMAEVIPNADSARVMKMGGPIVGCVLPALQDEDENVRATAGILFERISKAVGSRLIESVIESQLESSVTGVLEVVKVRPEASLAIVFNRLAAKDVISTDNLELIAGIMGLEEAEENIPKYYDRVAALITTACIHKVEGAVDAMKTFASYLDVIYASSPINDMAKMMKSGETREGVLIASAAYGEGLSIENTVALESVFKVLLGAIADFSEKVATTAVLSFMDLVNGLDKRVIASLDKAEQCDLTASKRAAGKYAVQFLDIFQSTIGVTCRAALAGDDTLPSLGYPKMFDTISTFYTRALDYGNGTQKIQAVDAIQELLSFTPKAVAQKGVATITGKCTKTLFVRNEGPVVAALLQLCLALMKYPTTAANERMVDTALASAAFSPALCDSAEARTLALQLAIRLVKKSPNTADMMLSSVVSKRNSVESNLQKAAMCRFISVVMRHGNVTKKLTHVTTLLNIVKGYWENAETTDVCAAAASAIGALCGSVSVPDDEVASLTDIALQRASTKSTHAIGAFACLYGFMLAIPARLDESVYGKIADVIKNAIQFGTSDRSATIWLLRCIGMLAQHSNTADTIKPDAAAILLKKTDKTDDRALTTANFCIEQMAKVFPSQADSLRQFNNDSSNLMVNLGFFDADCEDESNGDSKYFR